MLECDGTGSALKFELPQLPTLTEITMSLWVNFYDAAKTTVFAGALGSMLYFRAGVVYNGVFGGYDASPALSPYTWNHIVAYGNKTLGVGYMWVNGELVAKGETHTYACTQTSVMVGLATYYQAYPQYNLDGAICDFRMYDRLLDESEVGTIFNSQMRDNIDSGIVVWLPCDEPEGAITIPASPLCDVSASVVGTPMSIDCEKSVLETTPTEITPITVSKI